MVNGWTVVGIILADVIVASTLVGSMTRVCWGTFLKAFPPKPILDEHVRRNFQSYSIGIFNLGGCIHTIVDDDHLHLIPIRLLRWFGSTRVSIPWNEVKEHPRPGKWKRTVQVKIANQNVTGPRWALDCRHQLGTREKVDAN